MRKSTFTFPCSDGEHTIVARRWDPEGSPRGVVQIVHGMVEFIDRYDGIATYLADSGFLVVGHDQLAHGESVDSSEEWGVLEPGKGKEIYIADVHRLRVLIQSETGDEIPYLVFGHSMGSFIVRAYIARYGTGLSGAVVCGTGQTPAGTAAMGNLLARTISLFRGPSYRSTLLHGMADGGYGKSFEPCRTPYDWLSRDEANVDRYAAEPRNTFLFSAGGYAELTALVKEIIRPASFASVPSDLPLLIMSGAEDPVGDFGKGPTEVAELYRAAGSEDVVLNIYPEDRHEILNELDRDKVYGDVLAWVEERVR